MAAEQAYGPWVTAVVVLICAGGCAANAVCFSYIKRTFPVRKAAIFFLAFYDSAFSAVGNALFAVTFVVANYTRDLLACTLNYSAGNLQLYSNLIITAEIAVVRCASLACAKRQWAFPERVAVRISLGLHVAQCGILLANIFVPFSSGGFTSLTVSECSGRDNATTSKLGLDPVRVAFLLWVISLPLLTLISTLYIVLNIWKKNSNVVHTGPIKKQRLSNKTEYTIPVKATFMAVLLLISMPLALLVTYTFDLDKETRNVFTNLYVAVCNAARCPLQMAMTFSSKVKGDQESKDKRQERERQWAKEAAEARLQRREAAAN